jgi:glutamine amidotransferase-like uncharacterized protein
MVAWKLSCHPCISGIACLAILALNSPRSLAQERSEKPIRVALYADQGVTTKSLPEVVNALPKSENFEVTKVRAEGIRDGALAGYDVLICPGGSGSGEAESLGEAGRNQVRTFVKRGGGYVGICAGAYLASIEYPWSLGILNAHVLDRAHWDRGEGDVNLKISPAGRQGLGADTDGCTIHYENGPLLGPGQHKDMQDYELLASYDSEMTQNAPPGTMKGTAAIARGKFGNGRVVCFSPHAEKTPGRAPFLQSAVRWAANGKIDKP